MQFNIMDVLKESPTLAVLLFCSLLVITFALERWWFYARIGLNSGKFMKAIEDYLRRGKTEDAITFCQKKRSPIAAIIKTGLENKELDSLILEEMMFNTRLEKTTELERFLGILGTMGNLGPLIGLFGTVVGIMRSFRDLAASGSGGPSIVAAGIAEALIATAAGLIVAIVAVLCYNYFTKKLKDISTDMDICTRKLLILLSIIK
ncbi:MotA/TolQ/ExbB proton channel family protein [bacterium]|nr:MotA/TolQ/ExbB proton channel family protein [bacterium]MBU1752925.1 MotA/TolQ/ExbB proton channel family protein [bacterium]